MGDVERVMVFGGEALPGVGAPLRVVFVLVGVLVPSRVVLAPLRVVLAALRVGTGWRLSAFPPPAGLLFTAFSVFVSFPFLVRLRFVYFLGSSLTSFFFSRFFVPSLTSFFSRLLFFFSSSSTLLSRVLTSNVPHAMTHPSIHSVDGVGRSVVWLWRASVSVFPFRVFRPTFPSLPLPSEFATSTSLRGVGRARVHIEVPLFEPNDEPGWGLK